MKRKRIEKTCLLITILLVLQILISFTANAITITQKSHKKTITVDIQGHADFKSIQKAIDSASPGTTIYVKKGEYPEVIIIKKQIILIGENKDNTVINPISQKNKYAVLIDASNVLIKNFNIYNKAPGLYTTAIRIIKPNNQIENCRIHDTPVGITIWGSNNKILNTSFTGCKDEGIALIGSTYFNCKQNIISNCKFYNNCDGIELQYASSNTITNCEFYNNTHTGIAAIASSNNENIISNCKIYNNMVHGIYISSSYDNQILNCEIYGNKDNIVFNKYSKNNVIRYPTILENKKTENTNSRIKSRLQNYLRIILEKLANINLEGANTLLKSINF